MASEGSVARRYAHSLVDLAFDDNSVERVAADMAHVRQVLYADDARLQHVMANPGFTLVERRQVLERVFPRGGELHPLVRNLLFLLLEKHRFGILPEILRAFEESMDEHVGRLRATVSGAQPIPPSLCAQVSEALSKATGRTVELEQRMDPSLIAGLVLQVKDTVYDASLKSRLESMRAQLLDPTRAPPSDSSLPR